MLEFLLYIIIVTIIVGGGWALLHWKSTQSDATVNTRSPSGEYICRCGTREHPKFDEECPQHGGLI